MNSKIKYILKLNLAKSAIEHLTISKNMKSIHIEGTDLLYKNLKDSSIRRFDLAKFVGYQVFKRENFAFKTSYEKEYETRELREEDCLIANYHQFALVQDRIYYILPLLSYGLTCVTCIMFDNSPNIKVATITKKRLLKLLGKPTAELPNNYTGLQNNIDWSTVENKAYKNYYDSQSILGLTKIGTFPYLDFVSNEVVCYDLSLNTETTVKIDLTRVTQIADGALTGLAFITNNVILYNFNSVKSLSLKGLQISQERYTEITRMPRNYNLVELNLYDATDKLLMNLMYQLCTSTQSQLPRVTAYISAEQFISLLEAPLLLEECYLDRTQDVVVLREPMSYDAEGANNNALSKAFRYSISFSSITTRRTLLKARIIVHIYKEVLEHIIDGVFISESNQFLGLHTSKAQEIGTEGLSDSQKQQLSKASIRFVPLSDLYYRSKSKSFLLTTKVKNTEIDTLAVIEFIRTTLISYYHHGIAEHYCDTTSKLSGIWTPTALNLLNSQLVQ